MGKVTGWQSHPAASLFPESLFIGNFFEIFGALCPLLLVLGGLGGMYMLFQYLFQAKGGQDKKNKTVCGRCGEVLPKGQIKCELCGKIHSGALTTIRKDLLTALKEVRKLSQKNPIEQEHFRFTIQALEERLWQVEDLGRSPVQEPVPQINVGEIPPIPLPESTSQPNIPLAEFAEPAPPPLPRVEPIPLAELFEPAPEKEPIPVPGFAPVTGDSPALVNKSPKLILPTPTPAPQKSLGEWVSAFMESHNILLGELLGGLLIVGGTGALVATLWNTLEKVPYFPFMLLGSITFLLFLAGEYTLHRWKLETTSRGMLVISLLLLALSFLVLGNIGNESSGMLTAALVQGAAMASGGFISRKAIVDVFRGEEKETPLWEWMVWGSQFVPFLAILAITWLAPLSSQWTSLAGIAIAIPVGIMLALGGPAQPGHHLLASGLAFFSLAMAEGFLASTMREFHISAVALPLALTSLPLLLSKGKETVPGDPYHIGKLGLLGFGCGLIGLAPAFAWTRTDNLFVCLAGTIPFLAWSSWRHRLYSGSLAACFHLFLLTAMTGHLLVGSLSWGDPGDLAMARRLLEQPTGLALIIPSILLAGLVFQFRNREESATWEWGAWSGIALGTGLIWNQQSGPGYLGGVAHGAFSAGALLLHFARGRIWTSMAFPTLLALGLYAGLKQAGSPSWKLAGLSIFSFLLVLLPTIYKSKKTEFKTLLEGCCAVGGLLIPLSWFGAMEIVKDYSGPGVSIGLGFQALALFILAIETGKRLVGLCGLLLSGLAGWHVFAYQTALGVPFVGGVLTIASVALLLRFAGLLYPYFDPKREEGLEGPARQLQTGLLFFALLFLAALTLFEPFFNNWTPLATTALSNSIYLGWCSLLLFGHSALERNPYWFRWSQACLTAGVAFAALAWVHGQDWFQQSKRGYTHPAVFHALGCSLASLTLIWGLLRLEARNWPLFKLLWFDGKQSLDEWVLTGHAGALAGLTFYGGYLLTGTAWHGWSEGTWAWEVLGPWFLTWVAIAFTGLLVYLWEEGSLPRLELLYLFLATALALLGIHGSKADVPAGLVLGIALWFTLAATLLHFREQVVSFAAHLGFRVLEGEYPARMLRLNMGGVAAIAILWLAWEDCNAYRMGESFHAKIAQAGGWIYTGAFARHWAPGGLFLLGLLSQAVKEKKERYLFLTTIAVMLCLGGSYLRWLSDAGHLDIGGVVLFPQMMSLAGGLALAAWAFSIRLLKPGESNYYQAGIFCVGGSAAAAIVPGVVLITRTAHPLTHEAGALSAFLMLACVYLGSASMALIKSGCLHYRGLFLAGFALLTTLACKFEHEPGEGIRFLLFTGGLYLLLWPWGYLVAKRTPPRLAIFDFSRPRELSGLIQGFGLFLLLLTAWAVWQRNQTGAGLASIGSMLLTAVALSWIRHSDRQGAVAFWLASCFGALWTYLLFHETRGTLWPGALLFSCIACGAVIALLWGKTRSTLIEWQFKLNGLWLEKLHAQVPLAVLLSAFFIIGISYIFYSTSGLIVGWTAALTSRWGMIALLFAWLAAWKSAERNQQSTVWQWTLSALALGLAYGLLDLERGASFSSSLLTMGITWGLFSLGVSLVGMARHYLGKTTDQKSPWEDVQWLAGQATIITGVLFLSLRLGILQEGEFWHWHPLVLLASLQALAVVAWKSRRDFVLLNLLLTLGWGILTGWNQPSFHLVDFVVIAALAFAVVALEWQALTLLPRQTNKEELEKFSHGLGISGAAIFLAGMVAVFAFALLGQLVHMDLRLGWWCVGVLGAALAIPLLKKNISLATPGLFMLALAAIGLYLRKHELVDGELIRSTAIPLALLLFTSTGIAWLFLKEEEAGWLESVHALLSGVVLILGYWIVWTGEIMEDRLPGMVAVILAVPSAYFLARAMPSKATLLWQEFLLGLFLTVTLLFQSASVPKEAETWPTRAVLLQTSTLAFALAAWVLARRIRLAEELFLPLLRKSLLAICFLNLVITVVGEGIYYEMEHKQTPSHGWAFWLGFAGMLAFALASLGRGILLSAERASLPIWNNSRFTWACLGTAPLLFVHIRLCKPEWFHGWIGQYWSIGAMALAFLMGGLGEFLWRRNKQAVADPVLKFGAILPLAPLAAFWIKQYSATLPGFLQPLAESAGRLPGDFGNHAFLWFLTSMLWGWVAMQRQSGYLALTALAGINAAFWTLWKAEGFDFLARPQMWLIPPALTMLLLEQSRKGQIQQSTARFLRYFGLSLIYVSSTTELIQAGIGQSLWLPIVLAVWCVLGILAGMMLRLKGFIAFGFAFLLIDIALMIWHVAVDRGQTWVWWICLIGLGATVLGLFTFIEKHRDKVKKLMSNLKKWQ